MSAVLGALALALLGALAALAQQRIRFVELRNTLRIVESDLGRERSLGSAVVRLNKAVAAVQTSHREMEKGLHEQRAADEVRERVADQRAQRTLAALLEAQAVLRRVQTVWEGATGPSVEEPGRDTLLTDPPDFHAPDAPPATRREQALKSDPRPVESASGEPPFADGAPALPTTDETDVSHRKAVVRDPRPQVEA